MMISLVLVLAFLVFSVINASDLGPLQSCPNPFGFYLESTIDVQTFYPSYCQEWEINEISAFLSTHFQSYPAYDNDYGAIDIVPTTGKVCPQRRRLMREHGDGVALNETETTFEQMHRRLRITGFLFKMATNCKLCPPDNGDGRRRRLANTSPVTIQIMTDSYPEEFSYEVQDEFGNSVFTSASFGTPHTEYSQTLYLEPTAMYKVVMKDTYGDGICCFNGPGYLKVFVNGTDPEVQLGYNDGDFGSVATLWFTTPDTPTDPVVLSPSVLIPKLEVKYSDYLTYYLQQSYQYNKFRCMFGKFPSVGVRLTEVTMASALNLC